MKRVGKNSIALGLVMALISLALSFSANGASKIVAQAHSSAVESKGLTSILQGTPCDAIYHHGDPGTAAKASGQCGSGLNTKGIKAYTQSATAKKSADSTASATVSPDDITGFTALDIPKLLGDVSKIDTGTVLDPIVKGLDPVTKGLVLTALAPLVIPINSALQSGLASLNKAVPVSLQIGVVKSECSAKPGSAIGSSTVAGLSLVVDLGTQKVIVPIKLSTTPNSPLLVTAPKQLADEVLNGVKDSLNKSLGGALAPLNALVSTLQTQVVDNVLTTLQPTLLTSLNNALKPLVGGTVNQQIPVSPSKSKIDVTGLHLTLLGGFLDLAHVTCGPNAADTINTNANANANVNANAIADANANANADAIANANANANADADVTSTLPSTGAPNILPLLFLALGLIAFGTAVLANEKRRLSQL